MPRILVRITLAAAAAFSAAVCAETIDNSTFDTVAERLSRVGTIRGSYVQTRTIPALTNPLNSSGRFIVSDLGLYWEQREPFRTVIIADDTQLSQAVADEPMVTIATDEQPIIVGIAEVFVGIFRARTETIDRYFDIDFESTEDAWSMTLTPKGFPLSEAIVDIVVDGRNLIERLTVQGSAGDRLTMELFELDLEPPTLSAEERALYAR